MSAIPLTSSSTATTPPRPSRVGLLFQGAASVLVLVALAWAVDPAQLQRLPDRIRPGLLAAAIGIKALALLAHELRIWLALPAPRPAVDLVARIGFTAGLSNLILPGRAGDIAVVALLHRYAQVGVGTAAAAIGIVAVLEAGAFGGLLLVGLVLGATRWQQLLGPAAHLQAVQWVGLATAAALLGTAAATLLGRRLLQKRAPAATATAPAAARHLVTILREALTQTGAALSTPHGLLLNVGAAVGQVLVMIAAFALALPAVGVDVPAPFLAAAGVLGLSAVAAVVLPPGYGAGPAAASLAVLSLLGADEADALAYAGAWWLLSQVPAVGWGLPSLWSLGHHLRAPPPSPGE